MANVKMRALDQLHISSVGPNSMRKGQEFEVSADMAKDLEKRGQAERIDGSTAAEEDEAAAAGAEKAEVAPMNKAEKAPANKAERQPATKPPLSAAKAPTAAPARPAGRGNKRG